MLFRSVTMSFPGAADKDDTIMSLFSDDNVEDDDDKNDDGLHNSC